MAEFERPRPQAMSDAELARALQMFPSDATGVDAAGRLMAEQQNLRIKDSQELQSWIEHLKARDDQQSRKILAESIASIFPPEPIELPAPAVEPPLLTSELPILTRKGRISSRLRARNAFENLAVGLLLISVNALVLHSLDLNGLSAVLSIFLGLGFAMLVVKPLRSHALHPILRAATVFGGYGVYLFGGLILASVSLLYINAFKGKSELYELANIGPYSAVAIALVAGSALLGQLLPTAMSGWLVGLASSGSILMLASGQITEASWSTLQQGWHWGVASTGLISLTVLLFGTRHTTLSNGSSAIVFLGVSASTSALMLLEPLGFDLGSLLAMAALLVAAAYSGRDLAGGALGRFAGLAIVLGLLATPLLDHIDGSVVAVVSCSAVLMIADQVFRRSALHIPSLDTSYGFYGSFTVSGWGALLIAAASGTPWVTSLLPALFNHLEWSLLLGLSVGLVVGLLRVIVIRRQDREIKNLDSSSGNLENLLGL